MEGRFGGLYCTWAKRHESMQTPLIILENTPDALPAISGIKLIYSRNRLMNKF